LRRRENSTAAFASGLMHQETEIASHGLCLTLMAPSRAFCHISAASFHHMYATTHTQLPVGANQQSPSHCFSSKFLFCMPILLMRKGRIGCDLSTQNGRISAKDRAQLITYDTYVGQTASKAVGGERTEEATQERSTADLTPRTQEMRRT
jgi:hypothetical protein